MSLIQVGITDHLDPEVNAMLMAMYSRSYVPIATRIPSSEESIQEHKEKLGKFYIGYGHKSVGQLGSTTVWLEGISQLAAKAIENHPLFNGQESSTRYIDFSDQPMISSNEEITKWQEDFRAFYIKAVPLVIEKIKLEFPFESNQGNYHHKEDVEVQEAKMRTVWENTIKARAFDICRGILPAGCTTNAAFIGTFDTINDHFGEMLYHPCEEMRDIANKVLTGLAEKYKYAAIPIDKLKERFSFVEDNFFYQKLNSEDVKQSSIVINVLGEVNLGSSTLKRSKFDKVSRFLSDKMKVTLIGQLDFGSYRDIHRHRNGCINMEPLGIDNDYHSFYTNNLSESIKEEFSTLLDNYSQWYKESTLSVFDKQYSTPMGFKVNVVYTCDFNQTLYIFELRSGKTVHQTLRSLVQEWVVDFKTKTGFTAIHADMDEDNFSLKRGQQTFSSPI